MILKEIFSLHATIKKTSRSFRERSVDFKKDVAYAIGNYRCFVLILGESFMLNFSRHRFQSVIIFTAVRWNLQFDLSYRDLEHLLRERGVDVDHTSIYRWVKKFASKVKSELSRYKYYTGSWSLAEEELHVKETTKYLYQAQDECGLTLDFMLCNKKDKRKAQRFFSQVIDN